MYMDDVLCQPGCYPQGYAFEKTLQSRIHIVGGLIDTAA